MKLSNKLFIGGTVTYTAAYYSTFSWDVHVVIPMTIAVVAFVLYGLAFKVQKEEWNK